MPPSLRNYCGNQTWPAPGKFPAPAAIVAIGWAALGLILLPLWHPAVASNVKIAGLKMVPALGDKATNFARLEQSAREATRAGADIIVTPECFLDGFAGNTKLSPDMTAARLREIAEPADGPYIARAGALAQELNLFLVLGFSERRGHKVFNTAFFFDAGGRIVGRYSKSHLSRSERLYSPGTEYPVFSTALGELGMLICFDRQPPEPARILGVRGARLVLIPGYSRNVDEVNEVLLLRVRAFENGYPIAWVSPHNVMMIDRDGNVVAEDRTVREGIVYGIIDLTVPAEERDSLMIRHPGDYEALVAPAKGRP